MLRASLVTCYGNAGRYQTREKVRPWKVVHGPSEGRAFLGNHCRKEDQSMTVIAPCYNQLIFLKRSSGSP